MTTTTKTITKTVRKHLIVITLAPGEKDADVKITTPAGDVINGVGGAHSLILSEYTESGKVYTMPDSIFERLEEEVTETVHEEAFANDDEEA